MRFDGYRRRRSSWVRLKVPVCLVIALLLNGCGGSSDSKDTATADTTTSLASDDSLALDSSDPSEDAAEPREDAPEPPEDAPEPPVDAPSASAKPLLELGYEVTWSELLASVANERELSCINDAIDDEDLPDSFLDGAVMDETRHIGGWPTWHREILSIEVGDNHWPHQVWRCLEPATAAALYITVRLEELARTGGISIADSDAACIMRLPDDPDLSTSVSESLGTEYSFDDSEDSLAILAELDGRVVDPRLLPCLSEVVTTVVGSVLAELLGDEFSEDERYCMLNVLVDETTSGRLDVLPLFDDDVTDAYIDEEFIPALHASLETCSPSEAVEPGTTPEAAPGTETTSVAEMFADIFGERAQRALEAAERAEEEAGASPIPASTPRTSIS